MTQLEGEIKKISSYASGEEIQRSDIDAVVTPVLNAQTFDISNAIAGGNFQLALTKIAGTFRHAGRAHRDSWRGRLADQKALLCENPCDLREEPADVYGADRKQSSYPANLTFTAARSVSQSFCEKAVELCLQADRDMKRSADEPERMLEVLVGDTFAGGASWLRSGRPSSSRDEYDQNTLSPAGRHGDLPDARLRRDARPGAAGAAAQRGARRRGLIILTDSDGAGLVIRNFLRGALPKEGVLHAYVPEIPGKEKAQAPRPGKAGLLGVEGMTKEILLSALENAGADLGGEAAKKPGDTITKFDLYTAGLSGRPDSAAKRAAFLEKLRFPAHMSANALLDALNLLYTREEFLALFEETT